ncbi:MAG: TetR/AcrR family transcriptional regulator [Acidimicrobiales bacterium]
MTTNISAMELTATPARSGMRMSADERRRSVIIAACVEFARGGLHGTSTEAIAERAGISQPYLFRLFPTKLDLFVAAVERSFERVIATFEAAAGDTQGDDALHAMGTAYRDMLEDRNVLLFQLQCYAAAGEPAVQEAARNGFERLWKVIESRTGISGERVGEFVARGMLLNVIAALDLTSVGMEWTDACLADTATNTRTGTDDPPG